MPAPARARFSRALSHLYFARTAASLTWVLLVSALASDLGPASSPGVLMWILLASYPLTDAVATVVDIRTTPRESQTLLQGANLAVSLVATGAVIGTVSHAFTATLAVFGAWAIASGGIQLAVAVRRNTLVSAQWFMVISGAGSIYAGTTFLQRGGTAHEGISTLLQYSTGGALWYAVTATWLLAAARLLRNQSIGER